MSEKQVGVRELREHLGKYLAQVKAGETLVITERGKPVGRIVPEERTLEERLQAMIDAGLAEWSGKPFEPGEPVVRVHPGRSVADLVSENRDPVP